LARPAHPDRRARAAAPAVLACAAAAALAACHLDDRRSVTLQLSASGTCVRTSLACGGEVGVVVADATTNAVIESRCVSFGPDAGTALEKLPAVLEELSPPLDDLPPGRAVAVEVAVYSPASGHDCPRYDPTTAANVAVPSYFGRSGTVAVGTGTSIGVTLTCMPSTCVSCTRYASPSGEDPGDGGAVVDGAGSADAPFRTVTKLVASLTAGQTGCVEDGTYVENVTFPKGGSTTAPITLSAAPGAHPALTGVLTVPDSTDNIAIQGFVLDGATIARSAGPLVRGDRVALRGNDITNAGADCITLGDPTFGTAKSDTIENNRIHGCKAGVVGHEAETGYVAQNVVYDNTGDGVSLLPTGDSFTIEHNVIDGNADGVLFGSDGKVLSINDTVRLNIISNATVGFDVTSSYPGAVGTGNAATNNCLWMGEKGVVASPMKGFSTKNNVTADPMYVDRANKDFHLAPGSPCVGMGPVR
jgi:hypothetical protein